METFVFKGSLSNPFHLTHQTWIVSAHLLLRKWRESKKFLWVCNYFFALFDYLIMKMLHFNIRSEAICRHDYSKQSFKIRTTNSQFDSFYRPEFRFGYEPEITLVTHALGERGDLFVDVGSNWGYHAINSILIAQMNVIAFEANPHCAMDLQQIANELGILRRIQIFNSIVSRRSGELLTLKMVSSKSGMASVEDAFIKSRIKRSKKDLGFTWEKSTVSIDSLKLSPRILKIDVEGHDLEVMFGATKTIYNSKPAIIMEATPEYINNEEFRGIILQLSRLGYCFIKMYSMSGNIVIEKSQIDLLLKHSNSERFLNNVLFMTQNDFDLLFCYLQSRYILEDSVNSYDDNFQTD